LTTLAADAQHIWTQLIAMGGSEHIRAAGLGARDTLRLESAMPLYGHELSESISPAQTGLDFAIDLNGRQFPGRDAIAMAVKDSSTPKRVGLRLDGKRVPREEYAICADNGKQIGEVSSGTFSPTLGYPIAMGYVRPEYAGVGNKLAIDIRGRRHDALVVPLPFYKRS
jgi:aminomethyltransferase